ncbi:MAG TPA: bifunctional hydroxymethylpyrimidine kinase/phosphomethylpyrimidine kinase [Longimicrobiales bacterium]|nr:bifunctional hydroxymethylpyrimidine kinase/phosphomethylpyrimidine kinase [Longimicrobiales bacterium]
MTSIPIALTIAGSDSGGGAGIQADLKTFHAFGTFGTSVITALTAQNTVGVQGVHAVPPDFVRAQLDAVATDLRPAALKTGMLATAEIVTAVADGIQAHGLENVVADPVMIATSGDRLLDAGAERAISERLLPLVTLVTPNLDEASLLVGAPVETVAQMEDAAHALVQRGARAALVKGGHLPGDEVIDVLFDGAALAQWRRPRVRGSAGHGTGCTLSAAIAAGLAHGRSLHTAVEDALDYVHRAIQQAPQLGSGSSPLNHFVPAQRPRATSP